MEREEERRAGLRAAALIGTGMAAAGALALVQRGCADPGPSTRPPVVWVADRGAPAAFGLDAELFVTRRVDLAHPVALAPASGGGWWVLCAVEGWRGGAHRLERRDAAGARLLERAVEGPARLLPAEGGGVVLVPEAPELPWRRYGGDGAELPLPSRVGACFCAAGAGALAAAGPGGVVRVLAGAREAARAELGGEVLALAAGGQSDGWWAVVERGPEEEPGRELLRLGPALEERWRLSWPAGDALCVPLPDGERVWRVDREEGGLSLFSRRGLERRRSDPALVRARAALVTPAGELLVLLPGALLRFDATGGRLPGQGGFDFLADLAPVAQAPP